MRRTGSCYRNIQGLTITENARLLRGAGFDCVFTGYPSRERADKYAESFADAGLYYESIHAPFKNINDIWSAGEEGDAMSAELLDCLAACRDLGVPVMVVHLSSRNDAPCVNDAGHARWDRLVEAAVGSGVKIAFENQRKLANIAFVMELYRGIPEVGFCWDCGHEACFTPNIEFMPLFGNRLIYTHIHDNLGIVNGTFDEPGGDDLHYLPFDGIIDFNRVARHIVNSGYMGTLTLETVGAAHPFYAGKYTADRFIAASYAAIRRLADMCDNMESGKNS